MYSWLKQQRQSRIWTINSVKREKCEENSSWNEEGLENFNKWIRKLGERAFQRYMSEDGLSGFKDTENELEHP